MWSIQLVLYKLNLVSYADLSWKTYITIIYFFVLYSIGNIIGVKINLKDKESNKILNPVKSYEKKLLQIIWISTALASVAIIPNVFIIIKDYGINGLLTSTVVEIYYQREFGQGLNIIGYFSPIIYSSLIFTSVYIKSFGIKNSFLLVYLIAILNIMTFGGRNNVIISLLCISIPLFAIGKTTKLRNKTKIFIAIIIICLLIVFISINNARANITSISFYVENNFISRNHGLYKIYTYITGPLAYLNSFLDNPYHSFGSNTLLPIYKQLVKVGFDIKLLWTLPYKAIPYYINIGTYITELIIDFNMPGALIFIFVFGFIIGQLQKNTNKLSSYVILIFLILLVFMSIFMWYARSINLWIASFVGWVLSRYVESKIIIGG
jgi:oligosaccharide repeat unit polymerase